MIKQGQGKERNRSKIINNKQPKQVESDKRYT